MSEKHDDTLSVLLVYPDTREAALGAPGFREVLRALGRDESVRVTWGWYNESSESVVLESGGQGGYDVIAVSVPFEPLYFNAVKSLLGCGIEPERARRASDEPKVLFGGIAPTLNPAIAGAIADSVFIGEADVAASEAVRSTAAIQRKKTGAAIKLTPMTGMQIPGFNSAAPRFTIPRETIDSTFFEGFDQPAESAFPDSGLVEVGRGCGRGCRFCAAGHAYLPVRHRSASAILSDVKTYKNKAGRIGLVGASVSDHRDLNAVMRGAIELGFGISTSSFRADMLDCECASILVEGGVRTVTIAPEGGSERIRSIINKRLTRYEIIDAARVSAETGITNLRLYYMIGLPWEMPEDIDAIGTLTAEIRTAFGPGGSVTVSLNPFIPKPQTPFQWCAMAGEKYVEDAYRRISATIRSIPGVRIKTMSVRMAVREALLSLGDEAVGRAVVRNVRDGVPWKRALRDEHVDVDGLIHREKEPEEIFPWDDLTGTQKKAALRASYKDAERTARSI